MTLYFSDHFSLLVELAMPWPLGNMTAFAGQPVTTVGSGVQQPYQPSQAVNIYFFFYQAKGQLISKCLLGVIVST